MCACACTCVTVFETLFIDVRYDWRATTNCVMCVSFARLPQVLEDLTSTRVEAAKAGELEGKVITLEDEVAILTHRLDCSTDAHGRTLTQLETAKFFLQVRACDAHHHAPIYHVRYAVQQSHGTCWYAVPIPPA